MADPESKYYMSDGIKPMTKPKFINSVRELGKAYRDERKKKLLNKIELKMPPIPDEFCPKCYSLKRKPSKACFNHAGQYVAQSDMPSLIDDLAETMTKEIANNQIKVDTASEGRSAQRQCYLMAQRMLKKLMKEYKRVCGEMYQ